MRADVVSGKDVQAPEAAEEHVLRGPAADAAQAGQALDRRAILELLECLQVEIAGDDRPGGLDDRASLGGAEAVALERRPVARDARSSGSGNARGPSGWSDTARPRSAARRLSRWIPTASDSCWQATPLTSASKTVGKRGGLSPRIRAASGPSNGSGAAMAANGERSTLSPRSLSSALRASCLRG